MAKPNTSYISVTDQFCGAGGSSLGASAAGTEVILAMNHWELAIETHNTNFPRTDHVLADISQVDPRRYPTTDILITSPECTNHSLAKGQKRKNLGQLPLFGDFRVDPADERSRATMWDVPRFAEFHNYRFVIVENVVDARYWRLWDAWIHAMMCLDYAFEIVYLNSMFAHPTPQSRDRMYVVFWKKGNPAPDLRFTPKAYCLKCERDVAAVQSWKKGFPWGRYRRQYVYRCPRCHEEVMPYYYAAFNAIDWSNLGTRIGDRKRPLKERTLERIRYGLDKFGRQMMMTQVGEYTHSRSPRTRPLTDPAPTQSTRQTFALIAPPFLTSVNHTNDRAYSVEEPMPTQMPTTRNSLVVPPFLINIGGWVPSASRELTEPLPTQVTSRTPGLVVPPFLMGYYTRRDVASSVAEPVPTVSTQPRHYLVTPQPYIVELRNNSKARSLYEALATVTAGGGHHGLVTPFLSSYYGNNQNTPVDEAVPTVTTVDRHALITPEEEQRVEDCHFRMLKPPEIGRAMAFPEDYVVLGNQRQQVKQYGNAVTPPAMQVLIQRCVASLAG